MSFEFYDKVAKKFGSYHTNHNYVTEYPDGNPEKIFKEKLLELSGKAKTALDVGCADGRFTLAVASYFKEIIAVDLSEGMLKSARRLQRNKNVENVSFEKEDARNLPYGDVSFDIVYCRRGPSNFQEATRLLKPGGYFLEIGIGEKDCRELKETFGRGQNFDGWKESTIERYKKRISAADFDIILARDFFYNEYYPTYKDLDLFLQGVPIFEDFDSEKDKILLEKYVGKFTTPKGIKLSRHRIVVFFQK